MSSGRSRSRRRSTPDGPPTARPEAGGPLPAEIWELAPAGLRPPLRRYLQLLLSWNERIDLVAPADEPLLVARHLLDALQLLKLVPAGPARVIDVGSGAGLPGLIWALARPELQLVLLEPRGKRAAFLRHAALELGLAVQVREERVEQLLARQETYDEAVARALAPFPRWLALGAPLLREGGHLHAQAGAAPPDGWADPGFCLRFGLHPEVERSYSLPGVGLRRALRLVRLATAQVPAGG